ncbi:hypothetical protein [Streptomyces albireticuli]|uniref:hypothetical protein n=1 Tax=Streptomyces albireticuli TaxID=1940 RepID=UPI0036BFDC17
MPLADDPASEARAVAAAARPLPREYLLEARLGLAAVLTVELGNREIASSVYRRLLPSADGPAGAGSGVVAWGPVAHHLGALAHLLDRPRVGGGKGVRGGGWVSALAPRSVASARLGGSVHRSLIRRRY